MRWNEEGINVEVRYTEWKIDEAREEKDYPKKLNKHTYT